jgi:hypothetical protein
MFRLFSLVGVAVLAAAAVALTSPPRISTPRRSTRSTPRNTERHGLQAVVALGKRPLYYAGFSVN